MYSTRLRPIPFPRPAPFIYLRHQNIFYMKTWANIVIVTLVIGGIGVAAYKVTATAANVEAFAKQATFKIKVSKVSKEGDSIILKVNIEISNPTKTSVSFEKPYILIKYGNKTLTSSKASSDIIRIEPQSTTTIKNYTLQIPIDLSTASIFIDIARRLGTSLTFTTPAAFVSALSDTLMTQILPQLTLNVLVYLPNKSMPVTFETKLSN